MKQFDQLRNYCIQNGILYNEETDLLFMRYYELLIEKNKVMNLTAITEFEEVELKHFIDSLAAVSLVREYVKEKQEDKGLLDKNEPGYRIVDIGTGAGFPGLPLSFVMPEIGFMLADSLNKRIEFLKDVIVKLDLHNVSAIHARAEELGHGKYREYFDCCVSRAVADMSVLAEYCLPLVGLNGRVILYKSGDIDEELKNAEYAIEILGGKLEEVRPFVLSNTDIQRTLVIIKKCETTSEKYPRKAGKPSKAPLRA